ncbi:MAG: DNA-binding protein [Pseudonocardiales bacterium]|jgi:hypothetical protein|nr:DNA-binding protein [Pseudonocardiales bacterium]
METAAADLDLLPLPDVAERLNIPITAVHQLVNDGLLIALRVDGKPPGVPSSFLSPEGPVKHLPAVITLLRDGRYSDEEIIDWLFRDDPTIPGTAIGALVADRGTEIKRRAQAAGF